MARKRVVSRNVKNVRAKAVIYNLEENTFTEKEVYYPLAIADNEKKAEAFLAAMLCLTPKQKLLELLDKEVADLQKRWKNVNRMFIIWTYPVHIYPVKCTCNQRKEQKRRQNYEKEKHH